MGDRCTALALLCLLRACYAVCSDSDVTLGHIPGAPTLTGTGRPDLQDLFSLPEPYCYPFRRMLAHPAVISRLNWMIGAVRCPGQLLLYLDYQRKHLMPNLRLHLRQGYTVSQNTALCHVQVRRIVVVFLLASNHYFPARP